MPRGQEKHVDSLTMADVWLGEIDRDGNRRGRRLSKYRLRHSDIYVHLLAEKSDLRRDILNDLSFDRQSA